LNARTRAPRAPEASRILTSSLDYDSTLREVARLPIPRLADWSVVYVPHDGDARVGRLVVAHSRVSAQQRLQTIWKRQPLDLPRNHPLANCLRTREPVALPDCTADILETLTWRPSDADVLRAVGTRSIVAVPLVAHGVLLGGMMVVNGRSSRRAFTEAQLEPVLNLAGGSAQAIYNAQLFWEASLALQVRDQLISAASQGLLELLGGIRRRTAVLEQDTLLADDPARRRRANRAAFEIDLLLARMQRLVADLRAISAPDAWL
jgi:GAF domain-containing protein